VQFSHLLEEGDEADPRRPGVNIDEPGFTGQHDGGQHVVDAFRHRDDVRLDDVDPEPRLGPPDGVEDLEDLGRSPRERRERAGQWAAATELAHQPRRALRRVELAVGPVGLAETVDQRRHREVVSGRVLPHVHGGEVEAHGAHRAHQRGQATSGQQLAVVVEQ
jgi:hypothetical protein